MSALLSDSDIFGAGPGKPALLSDDDLFGPEDKSVPFGSVARGWNRLQQSGTVLLREAGVISDESAAAAIARDEADIAKYPPSPAVTEGLKEISEADGWGNTALAILTNPQAIISVIGESLPASMAQQTVGSAGFLATRGPTGLVGGTGLASLATEYSSTILDTMRDEGIDINDAEAVDKAFKDEALMAKARERGVKRGIPIATFDAVSFGLAGKFSKAIEGGAEAVSATRRGVGLATETAAQGATGAAGEATAQIADEGKISRPGDVLLEGAAEVVTGAPEVGIGIARRRPGAVPVDQATDIPQGAAPADTLYGSPDLTPAGDDIDVTMDAAAQADLSAPDLTPSTPAPAPSRPVSQPTEPFTGPEAPKISLPDAPATDPAVERPASPRLTAEDRASPIPNDLIDDGKAMIEAATAPRPSVAAAPPLPEGVYVTDDGRLRIRLPGWRARRQEQTDGLIGDPEGDILVEGAELAFAKTINGKNVSTLEQWNEAHGASPSSSRDIAPASVLSDADLFGAAPSRPAIQRRDIAPDTAVTAAGREVPVTYAVVEASSLVPSQRDEGGANPAYPSELQPRDRERAVSAKQVNDIAQKLNPRLIDKSPRASDGAPIVAEDGVVESGNGRVLAIRRAYAQSLPTAAAYRAHLAAQGYPVDGMSQPVLVRVRSGQMTPQDRQAFTREANERDTLGMSATERAMADAAAMTPNVLSLYRGGDLDQAGNRDFVRAFMQSVVGANEQAAMVDANGAISQDAIRRVRASLLAKAYGDADLVSSLEESADTNIKAIGGALTDVAAEWAQMRAEAQAGQISPEVDQTERLLEAVRLVERARKEGQKVGMLVDQTDMLTGRAMHPFAEKFLRLMFRNDRSWTQPAGRDNLASALRFYVTEARKTSAGTDLLGEVSPGPDRILDLAKDKNREPDQAAQPTLGFGSAPAAPAGKDAGLPGKSGTVETAGGRQASVGEGNPRTGDQPAGKGEANWLKSLAGEEREAVLAVMRDISTKVQRIYDDPNNRTPYGQRAAGSEGSRQTIKAGAMDAVRRAVGQGKTPDQAAAIAKAETRELIKTHNRRTPGEQAIAQHWGVDDSAYDREIDHTAALLRDALMIQNRAKAAVNARPEPAPQAALKEKMAAKGGEREMFSLAPPRGSDAFKRWFGDSKVVDKAGKPLVMYHGSQADIDAFDPDKIAARFPMSRGFYFVSSPSRAGFYADYGNASERFNPESRWAKPVVDGSNVTPVYLSIQNPHVIHMTKTMGVTPEFHVDSKEGVAMIEKAREDGHDGIIVNRNFGDEWDEVFVIAFKPTQIKSVNNRGTFDPADPRILYSKRGEAFRVREKSANVETELVLTDAFVEKADALTKSLRSALDQMGLNDVAVRVSESIRAIIGGQSFAADGRYFKGLIDVALDAEDPASTLNHEAIHAMRRMGLFTDTEWAILSRKSKKEWIDRYLIAEGYSGFPEWAQVEEGIAHAYADWTRGARMDGLIARSFKRIKAMLKALAKALSGLDFRTAAEIFEGIASGKAGSRPRTGQQPKTAAFQRMFPAETVDTLDGPREQLVIPGAEKISDKSLAERKMAGPLKPSKAQKDASGLPLFGDEKDQLSLFQSAWHGTPHRFDKFKLNEDTIGTGEGAQAFGWGLYFAGKRSVGEYYRNKLAAPTDPDDVAPDAEATAKFQAEWDRVTALMRPLTEKMADPSNWRMRDDLMERMAPLQQELDDIHADMVQDTINRATKPGALYEVDVPEDGELLNWDRPIADQPDTILEKLKAAFGKVDERMTGKEFYDDLSARLGRDAKGDADRYMVAVGTKRVPNDQAASIALRAAGIPGHRFLDGGSRRPANPEVLRAQLVDFDRQIEAARKELAELSAMTSDYARTMIPEYKLHIGDLTKKREAINNRLNPTYNYVIYDDSRIKIEQMFRLRRAPQTAQEAQGVMQGFIARGQPIDRAIRVPFDLLGGLDRNGIWAPGKRVIDKIGPAGLQGAGIGGVIGAGIGTFVGGPVGTVAGAVAGGTVGAYLLGGKIAPTGRFGWLHGVAENARRGLVDRYGLDPDYIKADATRATDQRGILQQAEGILKVLSNASVGKPEAKVLQAILTGENVTETDMTALAVPIRQAIDDLGAEAVSLGLISAESFERNRGGYLHRVYLKNEIDQDTLGGWVAKKMAASRKRIIGDEMKGRGLFWDVPVARLMQDVPDWKEGAAGTPNKGDKFRVLDEVHESGDMLSGESRAKPSRRVYWPAGKPVPDRYKGPAWQDRGTWDVRKSGQTVTLWRDYTKAEREKMGEIVDARYTIAKTFMLMANDLSTGRFFKQVSENEHWTQSEQPATQWREAADYNRFWNDPEVAWVKVPDAVIADTGGKKRWGALSGKYVRAEIWRDLNELQATNTPGTWRKLLTQWKLNKTARSPVVHMNNIMSNMMFMDMADVRMQDLAAGVRAYYEKNADYIEARDNGAFGQDMMSQEIRENVLKPILDEIARDEQGGAANSFLARAGKMGKLADILWTWAKAADRKMLDAYQIEDELFRMATFIRRRKQGDSPEAAAQNARDQFLNYDIRAPWINAARNSVFPFISYTYRAVPKLAENIAHRPWKLAKYFAIAYAVNALAYMGDDGDDGEERERASLRDEEQGYTWLGVPRMLRMPYRDQNGLPVFLDVRRWIPAGDIFDVQQGQAAIPVPAPLQFGGPLMLAFEFLLNRQAFTGQDITNELTDDNSDRAEKVGDWLWKSWMPSAVWVPNSWYWTKVGNALRGAEDAAGRPYSTPEALASSVGIKLKPQDVESGLYWHNNDLKKVQLALRSQMRQLGRQRERNLISQAEYDKQAARITEKFARLGEAAEDLDRRSQPKKAE